MVWPVMATLIVVILLTAGCGGAKESDPKKLVPAGANLIAQVQVATILEDEDLANLYADVPKEAGDPQTLDKVLSKATETIGVDLRQVTELVVFGDLTEIDRYYALIAMGNFDEDRLLDAIQGATDAALSTTEYKGRLVHSIGDENVAISLLEGGTLVLGTLKGVEAVIDVQERDEERVSGKVYKEFISQGDALVRLAIDASALPKEGLGQLPSAQEFGLGESPSALRVLKDAETIGVAIEKDGRTLKSKAQLKFSNESAAAEVGDTIDGFVKVFKGLSPNEEIKELLKNVQVSVDKATVTVTFQANVSELGEPVRGLSDEGIPRLFSRSQQEETIIVTVAPPTPVPAHTPAQPLAVPELGIRVPIIDSPHISVGETSHYGTVPATSGPHWPAIAQCGIYDEELPDELVVHNLEHGHVVISYNLPDPEDVRELQALVIRLPMLTDFKSWGILRPYSKLEPGTVALTAWGVMDLFQGVAADRIRRFYDAYHGNRFSAESQEVGAIPCR